MKSIFSGISPLLLLIPCLFLLSCRNGSKDTKDTFRLPQAGKVHEKVSCIKEPEVSFSLYLPSVLKTGTLLRLPVIIFFDPHGSGLLPVKKYQELAEASQYIIIGSCNSRNGQPDAETRRIASALLSEIRQNYPSDSLRIYLAGFSGGSRVAGLIALTNSEIRGVIGCGAGFPAPNQPFPRKFDYFGCAGMADFNLGEMFRLDERLDQEGFSHFIMTFNGPHAWPPAGIMERAIDWITFKAMKDGLEKRDESRISSFIKTTEQGIDSLSGSGLILEGVALAEFEVNALDGLTDLTREKKNRDYLKQNPEYQRQFSSRESALREEEKEQQKMMSDLFTRNSKWWSSRIKALSSGGKAGEGTEEQMKNRRLLAFLSILCYSNATAAMKQRNPDLAFKVIEIYELADPDNPEPNYVRSVLLMARLDTSASMAQLNKAISKGFSDRLRVMEQPEFMGLKEYTPYFDLVQKIK